MVHNCKAEIRRPYVVIPPNPRAQAVGGDQLPADGSVLAVEGAPRPLCHRERRLAGVLDRADAVAQPGDGIDVWVVEPQARVDQHPPARSAALVEGGVRPEAFVHRVPPGIILNLVLVGQEGAHVEPLGVGSELLVRVHPLQDGVAVVSDKVLPGHKEIVVVDRDDHLRPLLVRSQDGDVAALDAVPGDFFGKLREALQPCDLVVWSLVYALDPVLLGCLREEGLRLGGRLLVPRHHEEAVLMSVLDRILHVRIKCLGDVDGGGNDGVLGHGSSFTALSGCL
mmetsp:Transcript_34110/g.79931  ORF Transcript_34110/g.79931 Transcript_34110/m.79931 type:complete len:282 (+) Transcript_34110:351-1196(+)